MTQLHTSTTSNAKIASSMEGRFRFFDHKKRRSHDHEGHFRRVQGRMRQDLRRCGQIWEVLILLAHGTGRTSGGYVHGCTIRNGPCWAASFNPVIIPSNCHKNEERPVLGRYVVFATSLPVSGPADEILIGVPADYRRRGGGSRPDTGKQSSCAPRPPARAGASSCRCFSPRSLHTTCGPSNATERTASDAGIGILRCWLWQVSWPRPPKDGSRYAVPPGRRRAGAVAGTGTFCVLEFYT